MSEGIIIAIISASSAIVIAIISAIATRKPKKSKAEKAIDKKIKNLEKELKEITDRIKELERLERLKQPKSTAKKTQVSGKEVESNIKESGIRFSLTSLPESPEEIELKKLINSRNELEKQLKTLRGLQESAESSQKNGG